MKYNKGFAPLIIALIVAVFLVIGGGTYYLKNNTKKIEKATVAVNNSPQSIQNDIAKTETRSTPVVQDVAALDKGSATKSDPIINCGTDSFSNFMDYSEYDDNTIRKCLGDAVLNNCKNAKALLKGSILSPSDTTSVQIINNKGICYFKITANQTKEYNQCPIDSVKAIVDSPEQLDKLNSAKYAVGIFNYGIFGFMNENIQSKIDSGMSNSEIESVVKTSLKNNNCSGTLPITIFRALNNARLKALSESKTQ